MSLLQTAAVVGSLAVSVAAHGRVQGIVAGGIWYEGYNPSFQYASPPPTVIGWSDPQDQSNGFVAPSSYSSPDIICHLGATPAGTSAKIAAGDVVELQWTAWPSSHHGPVIDYLAKCSGSCSNVDKTTLEFFKIDQVGLVTDSNNPGTWGSDQLIANNNSWAVTIPKSIAPGNYVLRHEIIALHSAGNADGAQNYPQCINLEITGSGSDTPTGTLGEKLYQSDAPGVLVNIYQSLSTYVIPGPLLYSGAVSMAQTAVATGTVQSVAVASSTPPSAYARPTSVAAPTSVTTTSTPTSAATSATSTPASYSVPANSTAAPVNSSTESCKASAALSSSAAVAPSSASTPTGVYGGAAPTGVIGGMPSKPLPAGVTIIDLLQWLQYMLMQTFKGGIHQRDFHRL